MKILFVENHSIFAAQVVPQFLSTHEVTVVPSLAKARSALAANAFDLLLVDFDLDDGKGEELVVEVRSSQPALKIIGVSAHEPGNQALLKAGANRTCSKMKFDEIQSVIRQVFDEP